MIFVWILMILGLFDKVASFGLWFWLQNFRLDCRFDLEGAMVIRITLLSVFEKPRQAVEIVIICSHRCMVRKKTFAALLLFVNLLKNILHFGTLGMFFSILRHFFQYFLTLPVLGFPLLCLLFNSKLVLRKHIK